jgi:hypothetical protein
VTRATSYDLKDPRALVERILRARARAVSHPPAERHWTSQPPSWFPPELPLDLLLDAHGEPD